MEGGFQGPECQSALGSKLAWGNLDFWVGRPFFQKDGLQPRNVSRPVCLTGPALGHGRHREVPVPGHGAGLWFRHWVSVLDVTVAASFQALASGQAEFLL